MKRKVFIIISAVLVAVAFSCSGPEKEPVDYVNPYIGNISHLLVPTYPTVHLPNSMMRVYPERTDYTSDKVKGLPLIITSHRGKSAFNLSFVQGEDSEFFPYYSYHYDNEDVKPYRYSVYFEEEEVKADFAPSYHSGVYSIQFTRPQPPTLVFNTENGFLEWDGTAVKGFQEILNGTKVYIYALVDASPVSFESRPNGKGNYICLSFGDGTSRLGVRYGVSFIDADQARRNLEEEISGFDVNAVAAHGRDVWNETLGKIKVKGSDENALVVFYTSLYRTYERMICLSEGNRYFSAFDGQVHEDETPFYVDDWVWDTYRATHPLRILIEPEKETDMIRSYARMSSQLDPHWMPTFPEVSGDSRRMNSNHGVAFVADAWYKGLRDFDLEEIYEYCKAGITEKSLAPWSGVAKGGLTDFYWENGYIPALREGESETFSEVDSWEKRQPVAVSLGTAYDIWCLHRIASAIDRKDDADLFAKLCLNYRLLWNPKTGFFHPKDGKGEFLEPFSYERSGGIGARNAYDENNAWIYRWDVQHNEADLIEMMGGADKFVSELDRMFSMPLGASKYEFFAQLPDHTGNVGQFSMANEPSFHIPYLYNYAGAPWKTQKRIRSLLDQWYRNDLMGVPGDEDGGGMTAFVVFSMLGFYPVTPGLPMYNIGSPVFERASVSLEAGKTFEVVCRNYDPANKYIQSAKLNGKVLDRCWFTHEELMQGGSLELVMGDKPNKEWGTATPPPSFEM